MILNYWQDIKKTLNDALGFVTTQDAPGDGAPFGIENRKCLDYFLNLAHNFGFEIANDEGYAGHIDFGEGEVFSILCHLDVVPAGNDWTYNPFAATFADGKIFGRGIGDNKGQAVAILYCLKALKDEGILPKRKFRLILGCNEESGWKCMEHYAKNFPMSKFGFSPDADFPLINVEKGVLHLQCHFDFQNSGLIEIEGGVRVNMVPDRCRSVYIKNGEKIILETEGISCHGSRPFEGENAILKNIESLKGVDSRLDKIAKKLSDCYGNNCNLAIADNTSGLLTLNVGTIKKEGDNLKIGLDIRYPICVTKEQIMETIKKQLHCDLTITGEHASHYADADLPFVQTLLATYNQIMGTNEKPIAIGGATYARCIPYGVAFGPSFPNSKSSIHSKDENITEEDYQKMLKIYYQSLRNLS